MAFTTNNQDDFLAQKFCELAEKVKAGQAVVTSMEMSSDLCEGVSTEITCLVLDAQRGFGPWQSELSSVVANIPTCNIIRALDFNQCVCNTLTIDTAEHPMLDSDPSLGEYIKRVLIELGFKGEYKSHKMVTRPGKAPLLEVEGVA